ncbi:hypothetical protein M378DRAFT_71889 [Amanita muscaria Koide BX008]|uniref:Uncharacterized protein n=1 Tax=Amanita muscaria (strain Koide BX008) TaxID=946122 RepID=A0A0C2XFJ9_AMAMK|nr:hypothetical protein M378DRAFT_71889 [Amanita muscaria Koide BX008]
MSYTPFTRRQLLNAATTKPWTTSFKHLLPIPRKWLKRTSIRDPVIKAARPHDRIKYWNIVPGDQIRLLGDKSNTLHEVLSINRISNRVFVKGAVNAGEENSGKIPPSKNYHYSRCQLFIGNYEFPHLEQQTLPVFAQRLGTTKPFWNSFFHRFEWDRFATKTIPVISHMRGQRIPLSWPKVEKPSPPDPGLYDTTKEEVVKVTYSPPTFHPTLKTLVPRPPSEDEYLTALYNPDTQPAFGESPHVEMYLTKELSNPHSRAKKLKRWKEHQFSKRELLKEFTEKELHNLNGRTAREAKAEAAFKWREQMEAEKEATRKMRWKDRGEEAKLTRKKARKAKKEMKQRQRLTQLVLREEANQVVPEAS